MTMPLCLTDKLSIYVKHPQLTADAERVAEKVSARIVSQTKVLQTPYLLTFSLDGVTVEDLTQKAKTVILVDFVGGTLGHRRKFGGGKGQDIAKAVGMNKGAQPRVLDLTAGMGGDAFVLASLGCSVTMVERSPVVFALLRDGLARAKLSADLSPAIGGELSSTLERLKLVEGDSCRWGDRLAMVDAEVMYLDPMFPERSKTAKVKKDMAFFHELVGQDEDANNLLPVALEYATHRVVVKRPRIAPFLNDEHPNFQIIGKSSRFDVYSKKSFS